MFTDLQQFLGVLRKEREIIEISAPVDPYLEAAEIHRRVIAQGGPALLFKSIKGSSFPLVTNLFGTARRMDLAFGPKPEAIVRDIAKLPMDCLPPTLGKLWEKRQLFNSLASIGLKRRASGPVLQVRNEPPNLSSLPLLTTWGLDGGPFVTLPLVHTEHPEHGASNLGMYRLQRFDDATTGFHCQIGKGAGYHLAAARALNKPLPVNVYIGGPPALILSAVAPLPENVPELLLASLVIGQKLRLASNPSGPIPLVANAEFALVGEVLPDELRPEGPFGDHYGYYSLKHDYPVFRVKALYHKKNAVCAATVVGKPRQEDFFIGDYLQDLLSPLFPIVMPTVLDLWSYGETGYHSLSAAVVRQRYKRESMVSAFRILGEGQLSLTKFLLVLDRPMDLKDFPSVLEYILARADFRTDLYIFSNLSMDTLDYNGPKVNEGSKGVLLGVGDPIRELPKSFSAALPAGVKNARVYCPGCLVLDGESFASDPNFGDYILKQAAFERFPLIVLVDNAEKACRTSMDFLWTTFTRFEPGRDIRARSKTIEQNHISYEAPVLIDARLKPGFPDELVCDDKTSSLVDKCWSEYFPKGF